LENVVFAEKSNSNTLVSYEAKDYPISFNYQSAKKSNIKIIEKEAELTGNDAFLTLPDITQEVLYENVFYGIDLQYIVSPNNLKENIIIKNKSAQNSFTVNYNIGELTAQVVDDKTINLMSGSEVIYTISAPYMYDANGEKSEGITLTVDKNKNGKLRVDITVDSQWLQAENRAYPVVVDPWIIENTKHQITATYVSSASASTNYCEDISELHVSNGDNTYGTSYALLNLDGLSGTLYADHVVSATLNLPLNAYVTETTYAYLYEITSTWNAGTVTWNTKPSLSSVVSDYCKLDSSSEFINYDITKLYNQWEEDFSNSNGVAIMLKENGSVSFSAEDENNPILLVNYVSTIGIDEDFSYSEFDMGSAGYVYINNLSGNLVLTRDETDTTGENYPYDFSVTYNSLGNLSSKEPIWFNSYETTMAYGYIYNDDDGSTEKLAYKVPENTDEEIESLEYEDNEHGWQRIKIIDTQKVPMFTFNGKTFYLPLPATVDVFRDEERYRFGVDGLIEKGITEDDVEKMVFSREYTYNEDGTVNENLFYLVDGDGDKLQVSVTDNSITYTQRDYRTDGNITGDTLVYTKDANGNVTQITLNNNVQATFTYDALNRMTSVTNDAGYKLTFTYDGQSRKIDSVAESKNGTAGQKVSFERKINNVTARTSGANGIHGDSDDRLVTSRFSPDLKLIGESCYTVSGEYLGAASYERSEKTTETSETLSVFGDIKRIGITGKASDNLLKNHNIESLSDWTARTVADADAQYTASLSDEKSYVGTKSFKLTASDFTKGGAAGYCQTFSASGGVLQPGKKYVASAYINAGAFTKDEDALSTTSYGGFVMVEIKTSSGTDRRYSNPITNTGDNWERAFLTFEVPKTGFTEITVALIVRNGTGTAYFDAVQLEEGDYPGEYNMLENNSFTYSASNGYASSWSRWNMQSSDVVENGKMKIVGNVTKQKAVLQEIEVVESDFDSNYVFSGLAQAIPVSQNSGRSYRIHAIVYYEETDSNGNQIKMVYPAEYNYYDDEIQYISGSFSLRYPKHPEYTPDRIRIVCCYYNQANNAYYDSVSLSKSADVYDLTEGETEISSEPVSTTDANGCVTSTVYPDGTTYTYTYHLVAGKYVVETETVTEIIGEGQTETTVYEYDVHSRLIKLTEPDGTVYSYTYDDSGNLLSRLTAEGVGDRYNYNANGDLLTETYEDGSTYTYTYYESGELHTETIVEDGETSVYEYNTDGTLKTETESDGTVWNYTYNDHGHLSSKLKADGTGERYSYQYFDFNNNGEYDEYKISHENLENGEENWYTYNAQGVLTQLRQKKNNKELTYNYNGEGNVTSVAHNGFNYNYVYDDFGNTTSVKVGNQPLISYSYLPDKSNLSKITYGNGDTEEYTYNAYGAVTKKTVSGLGDVEYRYDSAGRLTYDKDELSDRRTYHNYDLEGRLESRQTLDNTKSNAHQVFLFSSANVYDDESRIIRKDMKGKKYALDTYYNYDENGTLSSVATTASGTRSLIYTYDEEDRVTARSMTLNSPYTNSYTYNNDGLIATDTVTAKNGTFIYNYTYDANGNITEITKNGTVQQRYVYDETDQLIREDNRDINKTVVYTYDGYGNILNKKEYAFTTGDLGAVTNTVSYTYDNTWKDKLSSYNGQSITYDSMGNPLSYRGATLTWNGRKLMSYTKDGTSISYEYDGNGLRTSKTVNGVKHDYYYDENNKLLYEITDGVYEIYYKYDADGNLFSVTRYRYSDGRKDVMYAEVNTRGDVIALRNYGGSIYCRYAYDSWGRCISVTDSDGNASSVNSVAVQNSIRYRGYVYDHETGFYYLQSRYYDPEVGRFLNPDDVDYIGYSGEQLSYNAFAYCENNAIVRVDKIGYTYEYVYEAISAVAYYLYDYIAKEALFSFINDVLKKDVDRKIKIINKDGVIVERDHNYMFSANVRVSTSKSDNDSMFILFGERYAWEKSKESDNHKDIGMLINYSENIYDEGSNIANGKDYNIYNLVFGDIMFTILFIRIMYDTYQFKKGYDLVWGEKGKDPSNKNNYLLFRIKDAEGFNGFYVYSYEERKGYKL
ncbi:MAG: DNRLRE domain-containing protein, partial [Acutalibacteraceae bacterium]|nr:DNRLRE domain-containing protein [Acutalibacteraceae bacterium]